jgi:hypothetical protein
LGERWDGRGKALSSSSLTALIKKRVSVRTDHHHYSEYDVPPGNPAAFHTSHHESYVGALGRAIRGPAEEGNKSHSALRHTMA